MLTRKYPLFIAVFACLFLCSHTLGQGKPPKAKDGEAAGPLDVAETAPDNPKKSDEETAEPAEDEPELDQKNYEQLPVDANLKATTFAINQMFTAGRFAAGQQATFDEYYQRYALPRWTQVNDIANLPNYRQELRNQLRRKGSAADVHDHLNLLVLQFMQNLIAGAYHPAVKVNAMLAIGELNAVEMPPAPLAEALGPMISAADNQQLPAPVRVAALVGIARHAAAGVPDGETRRMLIATMLRIANDENPTGPDADGREWSLAQALEILSRFGTPGENNAVFQACFKTLSNVKLSLATRAIAAEALGRLNYAEAADIKPMVVAVALGQYAVDVCSDELRQVEKTGYPVSRRRIKLRLSALLSALTGSQEGKSGGIVSIARDKKQQDAIAALQKPVVDFIQLIEDKRREGDDFAPAVEDLREKIEAWLKSNSRE